LAYLGNLDDFEAAVLGELSLADSSKL